MTTAPNQQQSPWPDVAAARLFLGALVGGAAAALPPQLRQLDVQQVAAWVIWHEIGPRVTAVYATAWPQLTTLLQADRFAAAAENQLHLHNLQTILDALAAHSPQIVALKGLALALAIYDEPGQRPMSDIDLWLDGAEMAAACAQLVQHGFVLRQEKRDRPQQLQAMAGGEIALLRPNWDHSLVELHYSPAAGWWLTRVAHMDAAGMWQRTVRLQPPQQTGAPLYRLSNEDMMLHVAVHLAVNHQVGMAALRSLLDMALLAQQPLDWAAVTQRARGWRVATAVYLALSLVDTLYGVAAAGAAAAVLRPSRLRRWLLSRLVTPAKVLSGHNISSSRTRYLLLMLLVDRPGDIARLVWRTLWPEAAWLDARYGDGQRQRRWHHLWQVLRYGRI